MTATPSRRAVVLSAAALAASAGQARARAPGVGWREALVIVPDLAPWIEVLTTVGAWEVAWRVPPDATLNRLWRLPPDARVEQCLMRNVGTKSGHIRVARVVGAPQRRIRPNDQAWETGGVQALDLRVLDMDATQRALESRGWRAPADPVRYTAYGSLEVIQWAPSSPDGVRLSFIQRIKPPLQGWTEIKSWSRAANAALTVADIDAVASFLSGPVGLAQVSRTDVVGGDGPNVMGLPWSLARTLPIDIRGFAGSNPGDSAIELIAMPGASGRDFAADAHPPNLGIAGLRFMVGDLGAVLTRLGVDSASLVETVVAPYGPVRAAAVSAPGGMWMEFLQPVGLN